MSKFTSVPAYSFQGKHKDHQSPDLPGPGAYEFAPGEKIVGKRSPTFAMSQATRDARIRNDAPGPGSYDGNIFQKPVGGIMGSKAHSKYGTEAPGPGAYENLSDGGRLKGGPVGFSFGKGANHPGLKESQFPGPGAYYDGDRQGALNKSTGNVLSRAARNYLKPSEIPGPGAYDQDLAAFRNKRGPVMSKSPRDGLVKKGQNGVGPGGYDVGREFDKPSKHGYKMDQAGRGITRANEAPGPGAYDSEAAFQKLSHHQGSKVNSDQGAAFGKSPRGNIGRDNAPGPGTYEPHNGAFDNPKGGGKGFIAKKGREGIKATDAPGPGAYDDIEAFNRLSSAKGGMKFSKASPHQSGSAVPGPGAYEQVGNLKSKGGIGFPKDPRDHAHPSDLPGPGAYESFGGIAPNPARHTFAKAPRDKKKVPDGPGYYELPTSIPDVAKYNYPAQADRKIHL